MARGKGITGAITQLLTPSSVLSLFSVRHGFSPVVAGSLESSHPRAFSYVIDGNHQVTAMGIAVLAHAYVTDWEPHFGSTMSQPPAAAITTALHLVRSTMQDMERKDRVLFLLVKAALDQVSISMPSQDAFGRWGASPSASPPPLSRLLHSTVPVLLATSESMTHGAEGLKSSPFAEVEDKVTEMLSCKWTRA